MTNKTMLVVDDEKELGETIRMMPTARAGIKWLPHLTARKA